MLSVVVPVYNVKNYLKKCVDSIINQSFTDIEIVLVDDGSTDGSGEMCDTLQLTDQRIKVIHKPNGGLMSAWIKGVQESNGDYIGFVDSDDFVDSDYFELLMKPILENDVEIAIGGYCRDYVNKKDYYPIASAYLKAGIYEGESLKMIKDSFFKNKGTIFFARWLRVIRKNLIISNIEQFDVNINKGEDIGIALATLYDADKIALVETTSYHYVQRTTSIMHTISGNDILNYQCLCANLEKICQTKGYGDYIYREFTTQMLVTINSICTSCIDRRTKRKLLRDLRCVDYVEQLYRKKEFGDRSFSVMLCIFLFKIRWYVVLDKLFSITRSS